MAANTENRMNDSWRYGETDMHVMQQISQVYSMYACVYWMYIGDWHHVGYGIIITVIKCAVVADVFLF